MSYWNDSLVIRDKSYPRFIGAPLDGVTNLPFRKTVRMFSPSVLLYTEICHVDTIVHGKREIWAPDDTDVPVNFQVAAADETYIPQACEHIIAAGVSMVDINVGCPAGSVVRDGRGAGSALMGDVTRLRRIISLFRERLSCVLTVKMRSGYKTNVALDVALLLQDLGVEALCVHPRLQTQKFSGEPDYELVAQIKKSVSIPVLVSGGISSWPTAHSVYECTGVDGFLVGRALTGRPWLLDMLIKQSQGHGYELAPDDVRQSLIAHLKFATEYFGPSKGLAMFKKHLKVYLSDLGLSRDRSIEFLQVRSPDLLKQILVDC